MVSEELPVLEQFRVEPSRQNIVHLVFDAPGRSMNVFSNAAIHELGRFAAWLKRAEVRGVVIRSGKPTGFCAGADLAELGVAYDMIMGAEPALRSQLAFDHFFPLSQAIRALETAGKPIAAVIEGLALGGGCELALGTHYRVLVDAPEAALGLPESLVGLLPGGGGTQRLPRLIGVEAALPILLKGARLAGEAALAIGLVDELVAEGDGVAAAERWILDSGDSFQPWDTADWRPPHHGNLEETLARARAEGVAATGGHNPALSAIIDCLEQGLPQQIEEALRTEMMIFSELIQRPEPRNMIQALFLGRLEFDRLRKRGGDPVVEAAVMDLKAVSPLTSEAAQALAVAGFSIKASDFDASIPDAGATPGLQGSGEQLVRDHVRALFEVAAGYSLNAAQRAVVSYRLVAEAGFPAHLSVFEPSEKDLKP